MPASTITEGQRYRKNVLKNIYNEGKEEIPGNWTSSYKWLNIWLLLNRTDIYTSSLVLSQTEKQMIVWNGLEDDVKCINKPLYYKFENCFILFYFKVRIVMSIPWYIYSIVLASRASGPFWTPKPLKRTPQDTQFFQCGISKKLNLKLIIEFFHLLIIPMTLFNPISLNATMLPCPLHCMRGYSSETLLRGA